MKNEMWWKCSRDGCFNDKKRAKLGDFDECFPGAISLGDVDGITEIGGNILFVDFKANIREVDANNGQIKMLHRLSAQPGWVVLLVEANPEKAPDQELMTCTAMRIIDFSSMGPREEMDVHGVIDFFREWAHYATHNPIQWFKGGKLSHSEDRLPFLEWQKQT